MMSEPKRIRETTKKALGGVGWGGYFFVFFILSSPFSLRRWRDTQCLLSRDGGGIRGGDAGRMLIKQNANWKSRKETQTTTPPFQHQPPHFHPHPPTHPTPSSFLVSAGGLESEELKSGGDCLSTELCRLWDAPSVCVWMEANRQINCKVLQVA